MEKKNLIIAEILCEGITNGVSRYVEMLLDGLPVDWFNIIYLKLVYFRRIALPKRIIHENYVELVVPLPITANDIIDNDYWYSEYNKLVEHLIEPFLVDDFIFHIQTMNLISLAVWLRQKYHCKIVSHIHCIPWKYKYSSDQQLFNQIYYKLNVEACAENDYLSHFVTKNEYNIVKESDAIICVTSSTKIYYEKYIQAKGDKFFCICNGIRDELRDLSSVEIQSLHEEDGPLRLLYVGNVTRNKGFHFVLKALRKVDVAGYGFILFVAGTVEKEMQELIDCEYSDLDIRLLGHITYLDLQKYYLSSHIGLISSLFEQCSYVALEMLMYGLPVVYSDIEGFDDVFDRSDDMYVKVNFSIHSSLNLDVNEFASKIIRLMRSSDLRKKISINERNNFIKKFRQEYMIQKTIDVYNNLYKE